MQAWPLKTKLILLALSITLVLAGVLTWQSYEGINGLSDELSSLTENNLKAEVVSRLQTEALAYGEKVDGYINSAFRLPITYSHTLEESIRSGEPIERELIFQMFRQALEANKDISSFYVQFEPYGYDGQDDELADLQLHHSYTNGYFELYWYRTPTGKIEYLDVDDSDDKYNEETNEFGVRESEWYLCPMETKQACLVEPYMEEIAEDYEELMTSLVVPVVVDNKFRGTVGADINLPLFTDMAKKLSASLYQGQARVTLLSQRGLIVASSHYADKTTRPLTEALPKLGDELVQLHSSDEGGGVLVNKETIYVAQTLNFPAADTQWSLLIELPLEVALADVNKLKDLAEGKKAAVLSTQLAIGLVLTILSLVGTLTIIRSITTPIGVLNKQVHQLASAEGDLSQRLTLDTHAELITLGGNFNRFMQKLRDLVLSLKEVSQKVRSESAENLNISRQTNEATAEQQSEIDNVVTATQEMSATAGEVARIASEVSNHANEIHNAVIESQQDLSSAVDTSLELSQNMDTASQSIEKVSARSNDINGILDVIRAVAEQTNLLALNAAIEAARAGEQGRGFAVVADEVRTLASRTQTSTEEINTMIADLQREVSQAVEIIVQGSEQSQSAMNKTRQAHENLHTVVQSIAEIADNIRQVATAAEEQSAVSEDITRNLTNIGDAAQALASLAQQASQSSQNVTSQLDELDYQLSTLRT